MTKGNTMNFRNEMNDELVRDLKASGQPQVFAALEQELAHDREVQKVKYQYIYGIAGQLTTAVGTNVSGVFTLQIEQGSDFKSDAMLISAFSVDAVNATSFPIPGAATFAGRGLQVMITDSGAGRDLTNGFIPLELIGTPGYGLSLIKEFSWKYLFKRTSLIRFDVRTNDIASTGRIHRFAIAFRGCKIYA